MWFLGSLANMHDSLLTFNTAQPSKQVDGLLKFQGLEQERTDGEPLIATLKLLEPPLNHPEHSQNHIEPPRIT